MSLIVAENEYSPGNIICEITGDLVDKDNLDPKNSNFRVYIGYDLYLVSNEVTYLQDYVKTNKIDDDEIDQIVESKTFPKTSNEYNTTVFIQNQGEFAQVFLKAKTQVQKGDVLRIDFGFDFWRRYFVERKLVNVEKLNLAVMEKKKKEYLSTLNKKETNK